MFGVAIGAAAGGLWALAARAHSPVGAPLRAAYNTISELVGHAATAAGIGGTWASVAAVVAVPVAAVMCAELAAAGKHLRRAVALLLLMASAAAIAVLPPLSGWVAALLAVVAAVVLSVASGLVLEVPVAAAATALAAYSALTVSGSEVADAAAAVVADVGGAVGLWRLGLGVVVVVLAVASLLRLARGSA